VETHAIIKPLAHSKRARRKIAVFELQHDQTAMTTYRIAPSILSADFARLGEEVRNVVAAGADIIHFDVMDNHYVPNLTIGPLVCQAIRPHVQVPIDVHLMVKPVDRIIPDFAKAGANIITFHPEASEHIDRTLQLIRDNGCKAGLVFNPGTPLHYLDHVMDKIDMILIMSVNPGFGGQSFIPEALKKIAIARRMIDESGRDIMLEVDGGIKADNIAAAAAAGADTFVAGSAIFGKPDYKAVIDAMRAELATVGEVMRTGAAAIRAAIIDLDGTMLHTVPDFELALNGMRADFGLAPITAGHHRPDGRQGFGKADPRRAGARLRRRPHRRRVRRGDGRLPAPLPGHQRRAQHAVPGVIEGLQGHEGASACAWPA
jgi:ribulose-phosphate 3-epimerase